MGQITGEGEGSILYTDSNKVRIQKGEHMLPKIFSSEKLDSRIRSANTQTSEMWLGYFTGPCFIYMVYFAVAGTYLTQFYTDVLGMSGIFLTMMPVISKVVDAVTNIIMGRIIDWYLDYVRIVVDALSGQVRYWMTFNEPRVFIRMGCVMGSFAPFEHALFSCKNCLSHMLLAHGRAVSLIRERAVTKPLIGIAMAASAYIPDREDEAGLRDALEKTFSSRVGEGSNSLYMDPIALGRASKTLKRKLSPGDLEIISQPLDFVGLNVCQPSNPMLNRKGYDAEKLPKKFHGLGHRRALSLLDHTPVLGALSPARHGHGERHGGERHCRRRRPGPR